MPFMPYVWVFFVGGLGVRTVTMHFRQYVRHGSLVLGVIRAKLCNGSVIIVGVCIEIAAIYMNV